MVQSNEKNDVNLRFYKNQYVKIQFQHCFLAKNIIGLRTF